MHISAVVADTHLHAQAMIRWIGLDPNIWRPVRYGERISTIFENAKIVRPAGGIQIVHLVWLEAEFLPSVGRRREAIPHCWAPDQGVDAVDPLGFSSMWAPRG